MSIFIFNLLWLVSADSPILLICVRKNAAYDDDDYGDKEAAYSNFWSVAGTGKELLTYKIHIKPITSNINIWLFDSLMGWEILCVRRDLCYLSHTLCPILWFINMFFFLTLRGFESYQICKFMVILRLPQLHRTARLSNVHFINRKVSGNKKKNYLKI